MSFSAFVEVLQNSCINCQGYVAMNESDRMNVYYKERRKKPSQPISRYYPDFTMEGMGKARRNHGLDS
jgi:hypothetical protein